MKEAIFILTINLLSIACVLVSGYMAIHGIGNWGWFFGLACLSAHGVKSNKHE